MNMKDKIFLLTGTKEPPSLAAKECNRLIIEKD